jgi:hypothetical protein
MIAPAMPLTEDDWMLDASCRNHPGLPPDSWFNVSRGFPQGTGLKALAICQMECPVKVKCRLWMKRIPSVETIAGGGWFDSSGKFKDSFKGVLLGSHQVALYLGVSSTTVAKWREAGLINTSKGGGGRYQYTFDEVVSIYHDLSHATLAI